MHRKQQSSSQRWRRGKFGSLRRRFSETVENILGGDYFVPPEELCLIQLAKLGLEALDAADKKEAELKLERRPEENEKLLVEKTELLKKALSYHNKLLSKLDARYPGRNWSVHK